MKHIGNWDGLPGAEEPVTVQKLKSKLQILRNVPANRQFVCDIKE